MHCIPWKKRSVRDCKLYLILDTQVASYERLYDIAVQAVAAGVDIVQLRDKAGSARDMIAFSKRIMPAVRGRAVYIINDRVDIARVVRADGVHLGQDDIPIADGRRILPAGTIIGVSCQNLAHARQAVRDGADYVGFGSVFKTLTKPDRVPMDTELISAVSREISIPVFAIGGITRARIAALQEAGVDRVAVCRAICEASDIGEETRALKRALLENQKGV